MVSTTLTTTYDQFLSSRELQEHAQSATVDAQPTRFHDFEFCKGQASRCTQVITAMAFSKRKMLIDIVSQASYRQDTSCPGHVLSLQKMTLVLFGTAPNTLQLSFNIPPEHSQRSVGSRRILLAVEIVCFWFDTRSRKITPQRAQAPGVPKKRRVENQIVRFSDTLCEFRPSQTKDDHDQKWSWTGTTGSMTSSLSCHQRQAAMKLWQSELVRGPGSTIYQCDNLTTNNFSTTNRNVEEEMMQRSTWWSYQVDIFKTSSDCWCQENIINS